jgi:hypothetical protein
VAARINSVRIPDEIKYVLDSIASAIPKYATLKEDGISLRGLSEAQSLAVSWFKIFSSVDEIIENLNMTLGDLERLSKDHRRFGDKNPITRYQLLVRTFFYEYSRFQDLFERYTHWWVKQGMMTKAERRELMEAFYAQQELPIVLRNVLLHGSFSWAGQITHELTILESAEYFGFEVKHRKTGKVLAWDDHLSPLCNRVGEALTEAGRGMQVFWSMSAAEGVYALIAEGKLKKAKRPFRPKHS